MIRSRALKRIKRKTPGSRTATRFRKYSKKSLFRAHPRIKREELKSKVRK
jgi:ribosomal protein L34E